MIDGINQSPAPLFLPKGHQIGWSLQFCFDFISPTSGPIFFGFGLRSVAARDYLNPPAEPEPESAGAKLERSVAGIDGKKMKKIEAIGDNEGCNETSP